MATRTYSASLSQSQGRSGYSIIFRHPARLDETTGKPGIRVRRGLGTRDQTEAGKLMDDLNRLLADPRYRDPAARAEAEQRFDPRVVEIYFDKMIPEEFDFRSLRDRRPFPSRRASRTATGTCCCSAQRGPGRRPSSGSSSAPDPTEERFPSTSTSKTTIADTEIIVDEGPWRAVVTFASSDEVREYLNECISAAVRVVVRNAAKATDAIVLRALLNHVNQRFRFSYVARKRPETREERCRLRR